MPNALPSERLRGKWRDKPRKLRAPKTLARRRKADAPTHLTRYSRT